MRLIVTGATGFVGSAVVARLSGAAHEVLPVAHGDVTGALCVDLTDENQVERIRWSCDALIHTAARLPIAFDGRDAEIAADINRVIDRNVFRYAAKRGIAVVYASTASVYGPRFSDALVDEDDEVRPRGPYSVAKLESEIAGRSLLESQNIPFAALRINAPYGPQQRARTVLQLFLTRLLAGQPLCYFGTGAREQDFTFITDVARAIELAAAGKADGTFNVVGGRPITMKALAELIVAMYPRLRGRVAPAGRDDDQEGTKVRLSCAKAAQTFGWTPATSLEEGLYACLAAMEARGC